MAKKTPPFASNRYLQARAVVEAAYSQALEKADHDYEDDRECARKKYWKAKELAAARHDAARKAIMDA